MKSIPKIWLEDKIQRTIWSLCIFLITLSWTLLHKIPLSKKFSELIDPKAAEITTILLLLSTALLLSYIRYYFQIKNRLKQSEIEADINDYEPYQTSNGLNFYILKTDQLPEKRWYCMNCMDIHRVASVVHPTYKNGLKFSWYCPNCKTSLEPFKYEAGNDGSLI